MPTPKLCSTKANARASAAPASRTTTTTKTQMSPKTTTTIPTIPKLMISRKSTSSASTTTLPIKKSFSKTPITTAILSRSATSTPRGRKDVKMSTTRLTPDSMRTSTTSKTMPTRTTNKFISPFKSFVTSGLSVRNRNRTESTDFSYDLSNDERLFMGTFKGPMKAVPDGERELLKNGQRGAYLALRYEHSPDRKYNFPEATSWRIGWLHNCQAKQQNS